MLCTQHCLNIWADGMPVLLVSPIDISYIDCLTAHTACLFASLVVLMAAAKKEVLEDQHYKRAHNKPYAIYFADF